MKWCEVCGEAEHDWEAHGEPLALGDWGIRKVDEMVDFAIDEALYLTEQNPHGNAHKNLRRLDAEWRGFSEDERGEFAGEVLTDIEDNLWDAGYCVLSDATLGSWAVYEPVEEGE